MGRVLTVGSPGARSEVPIGALRIWMGYDCGVFVRFVVGADDQHHHELTGVITEARLLRDNGELSADGDALLEDSYEWFNENLPVPPFSQRSWPRDVVSWFKDDAREAVGMMWDLVALLENHGRQVRLLRSNNPGRILYQDEFQIVVKEWNRL